MSLSGRVGALSDLGRRALELVSDVAPLAAEASMRLPHCERSVDIVFGFGRGHRNRLLAVTRQFAAAHAERVERWLAAMPDVTDVGFKAGGRSGELQVYVRGELAPATCAAALAAAGMACEPKVIRNGLRIFDRAFAVMAGLELDGERGGAAIYAGVYRERTTVAAISDAFRFLTLALAPVHGPAWDRLAPALLDLPGEEQLYVSFAPVSGAGWVKLDVGARSLPAARRVLEAAGLCDTWPQVLDAIERHAISYWSHVGVRLDAGGSLSVALYWALDEGGR